MQATQADVRAYLKRIDEAGVLGRSARRPALLEYLLMAELNGEGGSLKAYSIGIDVFGKPEDFDPTTDSSVRVEIGRLRTALALFEASDLADTTVQVAIPVGTYRPEITFRTPSLPAPDPADNEHSAQANAPVKARSRPILWGAGLVAAFALVLAGFAFMRWSEEPQASGPPIRLSVDAFGGETLGRELSTLVKDGFANTHMVSVGQFKRGGLSSDHFKVSGNVTDLSNQVRVGVELANVRSGEVVWNHVFRLDPTADLKAEVNAKLNGELETRLIGATKRLLEKRDIEALTPEQLFILGTWVSGPAVSSLDWEAERVTLMKLALDKNPDFGPAHSVLADKYGFLANMHPDWDTEQTLEASRFHAQRAIELSPLDSNVMFNVAQSYWHTGRHAESQRAFHRVTELDPDNSLAVFFARVVPYWCDAVPDDVMAWAGAFDRALSPDDPIRWIVLTWIAQLHANRGEDARALRAATDASQIFQVGYTYMLHAMLLNQAGQPAAARRAVEAQYANWPGIDADHYARSTVPRLCREQANPATFEAGFVELATALK